MKRHREERKVSSSHKNAIRWSRRVYSFLLRHIFDTFYIASIHLDGREREIWLFVKNAMMHTRCCLVENR